MTEKKARPRGELATRTVALPRDTNPSGDIFGGWLMSQMDIAGGVSATRRARGRVATVAVDGMVFHEPVRVGNVVACHAEIVRVGTTSITVRIEAWAERRDGGENVRVTEATFTYVAIDETGRKRPVPPE